MGKTPKTYRIGMLYVLYPVSETYRGQQQWEVENSEGKRIYMTAAEINETIGMACTHEHTFADTLLRATRCSACGRIMR